MATKKTNKSEGHPGAAAVAIAGALAAAAGAYFLYGSKDAKKNRKAVKSWSLKAKAEVVERLEKVKGEINEENYHKIVDGVMIKYNKLKAEHGDEVESVVKELKSHWKNIKTHLKTDVKVAKKAVKTAKKEMKKAVKKVTK